MPRNGPRGRHRAPSGGKNFIWPTIIVLTILGAIFVAVILPLGGYFNKSSTGLVSVVPQESFRPALPAIPASLSTDNKDCQDFFDRIDAQNYFEAQGGPTQDPDHMDIDHDGLACEDFDYSSTDPPVPASTQKPKVKKLGPPDYSKVNTK
jgi:hypothetical protein